MYSKIVWLASVGIKGEGNRLEVVRRLVPYGKACKWRNWRGKAWKEIKREGSEERGFGMHGRMWDAEKRKGTTGML